MWFGCGYWLVWLVVLLDFFWVCVVGLSIIVIELGLVGLVLFFVGGVVVFVVGYLIGG